MARKEKKIIEVEVPDDDDDDDDHEIHKKQ